MDIQESSRSETSDPTTSPDTRHGAWPPSLTEWPVEGSTATLEQAPEAGPEGATDGERSGTSEGGPLTAKRLGVNTLLYGFATMLSRAVGFVMLPVYTRFLSPADYGVIQLLDMTLDITAILLTAGVTAGVQRFYFTAETERERRAVLFGAYMLEVGLAAIGTVLLWVSAPVIAYKGLHGAASPGLVRLAALNFSIGTLVLVPLSLLQMQHRAAVAVATSVAKLSLQITYNILFVVVLGWGVRGFLTSTLIANVVLGVIFSSWLLRQTGFTIDWPVLRKLRRFGVPYQLAFAGSFLITFGDRFFLQAYRGVAEVGRFSLSHQFGFLLASLTCTPFLTAWNPHRHQLVASGDPRRDEHFARGMAYYVLLLFTVAIGIALLVRPTLHVMTTRDFYSAAGPVPIVLASYIMQSLMFAVLFGIDVSERTQYATYATWLSVGVVLLGDWLLIRHFGGYGAATATLLGFTVRFGFTYYWSQKLFPIRYQLSRSIPLAVALVAIVGGAFAIPAHTLGIQVAVAAVGLAAWAVVVWTIALLPEDRARVVAAVRSPSMAVRLLVS